MSGIKLIEHDIKGKSFDFRRRKRIETALRILAVAVIIGCIILSWWIIKTWDNKKPVDAEVLDAPMPSAEQTPPPETNVVLGMADITSELIASTPKTAYLTFDDGPSKNTERILDILVNYGVKATFFVTGETVQKYPELVQKLYEEGHSIGNHSYSHKYEKIYATKESFTNEILDTEKALGGIIGSENVMKLFRFPGGSAGEKKQSFIPVLEEIGYKYVDWNALNGDAEGEECTAEKSISEIKKYCTDTGSVVVLMHDTAVKETTVQTLPQIIEYLVSQGYTFDRIVVD